MTPSTPPRRRFAWRFRPRALPARGDRAERFTDRLAPALEAGHSLPGELRLLFRSGPAGGVEVAVSPGPLERWWANGVVPLFAPGQWTLEPTMGSFSRESAWVGGPLHPFPRPLWCTGPTVVAHRLGLVLGTLPSGLALEWALRPSAVYAEPTTATPPLSATRTWTRYGSGSSVRGTGRWDVPAPRDHSVGARIWASQVTLGRIPSEPEPTESEREALERVLWGAEGNGLRFTRSRWWSRGVIGAFPLRGTELASLVPHPAGESWPTRNPEPRPGGGVRVGLDDHGHSWTLAYPQDEGRHLAVLGETGMGKSSFLVTLGTAVAREHGVVFLDPMGDAARQLLAGLPSSRASRVLWFSPTESPCGLNALNPSSRGTGTPASPRRISDLVQGLRRVRAGHYVERSFWGPRIEEMLGRALTAAATLHGTLVDAHRLLEEAMEGGRVTTPAPWEVRTLFERVHQRPEDAEGACRLLYEFVSNPDLVRMLCERDPERDASDLVRAGGITVISGEASQMGEATTRRLFAAYLAMIWSELVARPPSSKTFVFLDEVQWFGHEALGEMLRLGRRFNVHVVIGTQSLTALPEELADAVRTNVADWLLFRGSPDDLREFARSVPGLVAEDVLALGSGEAVFLEGRGRNVRFVRVSRPTASLRGSELVRRYSRGSGQPSRPHEAIVRPDIDPGIHRAKALESEALPSPEHTAPGADHRVYLADLGAEGHGDNLSVRKLGGELGRRGAIRSRGTDGRGTYWELSEDGFRWLSSQNLGGSTREEPRFRYHPTEP